MATALQFREIRPDLSVLSLDRRVRENAVALGFEVMPGEAQHVNQGSAGWDG